MSVYLMNFNLMIIFLFLAVFMTGCLKIKVIEDKVEIIRPQAQTSEEEKQALSSLDDVRTAIESKAEGLVSLTAEIATDKKSLDEVYQKVLAIDLVDESVEVDIGQSKAYYDFFDGAQQLSNKVATSDIEAKINEVNDLRGDAEAEGRKLIDSMKVQKLVDNVRVNASLAESEQNKVDAIVEEIKTQKKIVQEKINRVAVGFEALKGEKISEALDTVIAGVDATASLNDINILLNHNPNFFSLPTEIGTIKPEGERFFEYYEGRSFARPIVLQEMERIVAEAIRQKAKIDAYFNGGHPQPTNQNEFDVVARSLDAILGGNELITFAGKRGVENAEDTRKTAALNVLDPPRAPGAPPVFGIVKPKVIVEAITQKVSKVSGSLALNTAISQIKTAVQNSLKSFYDAGKLNAILTQIENAGDPTSPSYKATYENLVSALEPYTIDGLKDLLREGGVLNGSVDEREFYKNFLIIMKSSVNPELFKRIRSNVDNAITERVKYLKNYLVTVEPTYVFIESEFKKLKNILNQKVFNAQCIVVRNALTPVLKHTPNCELIAEELKEAVDKADQTKLMWDQVIFEAAARKITEPFYKAFEETIENAGGKEEKVKIRILNTEEEHYLLKGESDLQRAIKQFNEKYLTPSYAVSMASLPKNHFYSNQTLIELIAHMLATTNFAETGKKPLVYGPILDAYENSLFPTMRALEITAAFDQIKNTNPAAKLHLVLSSNGYDNVVTPYKIPADKILIENMRQKALGKIDDTTAEGAGLPEFLEAFSRFENAIGEEDTKEAIEVFAKFFNDNPPKKLKTNLTNAVAAVGVDKSADFSLLGQLGSLKKLVEKNPGYNALSALAAIDTDLVTLPLVHIVSSGASNSLEERAGPDSGGIKNAIPESMRRVVFGVGGAGVITVMQNFMALKDNLKKSLVILKENAQSRGGSKGEVESLMNAFNLVFLYPISEMLKLSFDGTDDDKVAEIYARFDVDNAKKFKRLKSVVGLNIPGKAEKREIFKLLEGYTDSTGTDHIGLRQKMASGTSTSAEVGEIRSYVSQFLQ